MQDLNSLTRDQTWAPCSGTHSPKPLPGNSGHVSILQETLRKIISGQGFVFKTSASSGEVKKCLHMKCPGESGKFFKSEGVQHKEVKAFILMILQLTIY